MVAGVSALLALTVTTSCSSVKDPGSKPDANKPVQTVAPTLSRVPVTAKTTYVALGDSYAAGVKIPPLVADAPAGCSRSQANYAHLVAQRIGIVDFVDVTCSGATTVDMAAPQKVAGSPPPQLDALRADTGFVILGIGGNDFGFTEVLRTCGEKALNRSLSPCKNFFTADGHDELARRIEELGPRIAGTLDAIKRRAPTARILVVGYPSILPESGPVCPGDAPFAPGDIGYLRDLVPDINNVLATRAKAAGAEYADIYTPSLGHDVCRPVDTKWVEGADPAADAAPMHPNARGHQGIAETILGTLD
ncbi:lipase [Embleya hyalina]|uniref:Lipase n=2 Tax=Embleya hyalina TaxID=516124 RepID=A0A401Z5T4_9ACTN|nr:lipase [Embleya hyalina]